MYAICEHTKHKLFFLGYQGGPQRSVLQQTLHTYFELFSELKSNPLAPNIFHNSDVLEWSSA